MPTDHAARSKEYFERREQHLRELTVELGKLPRQREYVLEFGCGHGHFLTGLAQRNAKEAPELFHLGLDIKSERIAKALTKTRRAKLENIHWLACDVFDLLERWPAECQIKEVFVLFPDPWPRARHHKNRFVNARLFEELARRMHSGAKFHYRGDSDEYTEAIKEVLANQNSWELEAKDSFPQGLPPSVFQGHHPTYQTLTATLG